MLENGWLEPESLYAGLKNLTFTFKLSKNITYLENQFGSCALGDLKGRKIKTKDWSFKAMGKRMKHCSKGEEEKGETRGVNFRVVFVKVRILTLLTYICLLDIFMSLVVSSCRTCRGFSLGMRGLQYFVFRVSIPFLGNSFYFFEFV